MTDAASLILKVDATQVKSGVAALDGLTAAGTRAEIATGKMGGGLKTAGVQATAMAAAAQASARSAVAQAAGFEASAASMRVNTIAMRETLVVSRELARGNFTRIPGSLSLLVQNMSGGFGAFTKQLLTMAGVIKTVQNAELAAAAASAEASAASIRGAAERAGANILAADTELALAQAAVRTATTSEAEAAAQAQLAAAHQAVAAAAAEAAIAENALAAAQGRAAEEGAASAAASRTLIGGTGIGLIGIGTVALVAYGAIKQFQDQVRDSGALDKFAESSRLSAEQIKSLGGEVEYTGHNIRTVSGLTVTFGDVMVGVWQEIEKEAGLAGNGMGSSVSSALSGILDVWNKTSAGISAGLYTLADIAKDVFQYIGQQIGQGFYTGVNKAIDAINGLNAKIPKWAGGGDPNLIPHLAPDKNVSTLPGLGATIRRQADKNYADALAANLAAGAGIEAGALDHRAKTLQALSDAHNPPKGPKEKKQSDHGLAESLAKLDAEIKGQLALAAAYQVSDAAVMKAEALQKAEEDAIKHKSQTGVFYEKELAKAVATRIAQGEKAAADLQFETGARKQVNDAVAAGTMTMAQANDQMKLEAELRPLIAAYDAAAPALKKAAANAIRDLTKAQRDSNAETARTQALSEIASNDNDIAKLKLESSLIGASNRERAVALAQLDAMQKIKADNITDPALQATLLQQAATKAVLSVQTPFQQWAASVPQDSKAITDALQSIEFNGFDNLASSITDVITGTKSLGAAFKDIAHSIISDIIQMTIKMLIFRALSAVFGFPSNSQLGAIDVSGFSGGLTGSAKGNVFSGGNVIPFANGGIVTGPTLFPMANGGTGLMGEAGTEAVMPLARDSSGRLGVRANDNRSGPIEVHVTVDASPELDARIVNVSAQTVGQAAPVIVKAAVNQTMRIAGRQKLNGR